MSLPSVKALCAQALDDARKKIARIDLKLLELLARRLSLVRKVGEYKRAHELPIEDLELEINKRKEREKHARSLRANTADIEAIFAAIVKVSRVVQRRDTQAKKRVSKREPKQHTIIVAVMGSRGSFSEQAAQQYLREGGYTNYGLTYPISAEGVLQALENREADLGIFPIHNSIGGIVLESIYAASEHAFVIDDIFGVDIRQCLLTLKGVAAKMVKRIMSHPQALAQCRAYLKKNFPKAELIETNDTATAAHMLSQNPKYRDTAVIAPKQCADMYGLKLLAADIQDQKVNITMFIAARP